MTVNLTRIYTRLGDDGETHLGDMSRVPKTHPRIEAYGTVDELNAHIGLTITVPDLPEQYRDWLRHVQNDLFDVGADISAPEDPERERLRVLPAQTEWLEQRCDEVNATLKPLKSFVLPGGTVAAVAPPRLPDGVPAGGAARDRLWRRRGAGGRAVSQSSERPAVHPQPGGEW